MLTLRNFSIMMFVVLCSCIATFGATITVGLGGGYDYTEIQPAIDDANSGDTILVYPGTYSGPNNVNLHWSDKHLTVRSQTYRAAFIDGEGISYRRGFYFNDTGQNSSDTVDGFAIMNCTGNADACGGGGILCNYTSPNIMGCYFYYCEASYDGGGISCRYDAGTISDCVFDNCTTDFSEGGGVSFHYCNGVIEDCSFAACSASAGGGIVFYSYYPDSYDLTVTDSVFTLCSCASTGGGAIAHYAYNSNLSIDRCLFEYNSSNSCGGAIYAVSTVYGTFKNSVFQNNSSATSAGGAIYWDAMYLWMRNCTVVNNYASCNGGGLHVDEADAYIGNCIFWDNYAESGGCNGDFGGPYDATVEYCDINGGFEESGSYDITWGSGNKNVNPYFASDGYHLTIYSGCCIDMGKPGDYSGEADIDGQTRVNPNTRYPNVDIGADEYYSGY